MDLVLFLVINSYLDFMKTFYAYKNVIIYLYHADIVVFVIIYGYIFFFYVYN